MNLYELEKQYGLPSGLLTSVMKAESAGNPNAVSPRGALGLFQFMPETAKQYGINPLDPEQAAQGAARMYGDLIRKYGDIKSALAAYNWGQGNVDRKGTQNAPAETQNYIEKVLGGIGEFLVPSANAAEIETQQLEPQGETIDVEMPDGTVIEGVPEGTTKAQLTEMLAQKGISVSAGQEELPEQKREMSALEQVGSALRGYTRGATFGHSDEIEAGLASPIIALLTQKPIGQAYEMGLNTARGLTEEQTKEAPVTTLLSDIAGSVATGGAALKGVKALAKASPIISRVASTAAKFGQANPVKASAGVGALAGAVRGFGEGEGGFEDRVGGAETGAAIGGAGGAVLSTVAGKIGGSVGKKSGRLERTAQKLGYETAPETTAATKTSPATLATTLNTEELGPGISQQADELFPKTTGQRTQNADIQRLENAALAGTVSPAAQQAGFDALAKQNTAIKGFLQKIGGNIETGRDINALVDDVGRTVQSSYSAAKEGVDNAYKLAHEGDAIKIGTSEIKNGLFTQISRIRQETGIDLYKTVSPKANSVVKRLARYATDKGVTATKLRELENWRTMATSAARDTQGTSEGVFLKKLVKEYDVFMRRTAESAADIGDKNAIRAFRDAVSKRADMGRIFERNAFVEDLAKGRLNLDDARNRLIGTGAIKGKREMAETLDALIKASGKEANNVKVDLQNAFIKRIYQRSEGGFVHGSNTEKMLSPSKLRTELENLFIAQSEFAKKLYGEETVSAARQAIKELDLIKSTQISTRNPSGSGEIILRAFNNIVDKIPVVGQAKALVAKGGEAIKSAKDTKKVLGYFSGSEDVSPTSSVWSASKKAGAVAGGSLAARDNIPTITITPKKKDE